MPYSNLLLNITEDIKQDLLNKVNTVYTSFPQLVSLTVKEKKQGLKLGHKTESFLTKTHLQILNNPGILPSYLSSDDYSTKVNDWKALTEIESQVRHLLEAVVCTKIALEQEAVHMALNYYGANKLASEQQVPGAKKVVADLA